MTTDVLETRGAHIAYDDRGEGTTTYLFLHYWGGSKRTWDRVVDELQVHARCVALDQRGWGGSVVDDGRFDLEAMADDIEDAVRMLGLQPYVLVGHSMGGKVAQIVTARGTCAPAGLVLVAPAPPEPMAVPREQREAMRLSYGSPDGVNQAISILAGRPLTQLEHQQVVEDTLSGADEAKQEWTERGMTSTVDSTLSTFRSPVRVLVGDKDQVERAEVLGSIFARWLPQAELEVLSNIGHLLPLEAPQAIAAACREIADSIKAVG